MISHRGFWNHQNSDLKLMALVNSNLTCSKSCYRCHSYQKRGQESCKFQFSPAPANSKTRLVAFPWPKINNNDNCTNNLVNSKNIYTFLLSTPKSFYFAHQTDHIHTFLVTGISVFQRIPRWSLHWELLLDRYDIWNLGMQFGKLRKWNFNFPGTLSATWIIWEAIASLSLFLIEERLLWKLTRRETGWHSSNIRLSLIHIWRCRRRG